MAKAGRPKIERRSDALLFVSSIVSYFDTETRCQSGSYRLGAIGTVGSLVFSSLAEERGAFVRPIPVRKDYLCANIDVSGTTITRAIRRLVDQGLLTMSGPRGAPTALLHLPQHVIDLYELHQRKLGMLIGGPIGRDELERAVALLNQADVDEGTEHDE